MPDASIKTLEASRAAFAYKCAFANVTFSHEIHKVYLNELANSIKQAHKKTELKGQVIAFCNALSKLDQELTGKDRAEKIKQIETEKKIPKNIKEKYYAFGKEYKSYARKLPMLIKTNGLGATMGYVFSKSSNYSWALLYQQTQEWLITHRSHLVILKRGETTLKLDTQKCDLMAFIPQMHSNEYRMLTIELLAFYNWLRRFAEGLIEGETEEL